MGRTLDVRLSALILSFLVAGGLVVRASAAAFSDSTDNTGNTFTAGDVVISDDDAASSMFAVTGMEPGETDTKCINVTYSGSMDAEVRRYGAATAGDGLEDFLDVTVERSTDAAGGATADCTGFTEAGKSAVWTNASDGDLGAFLSGNTDYASGADSWAVTGGGANDVASYKVIVTLQDDNGAQGLSSTVSFTWEVQNT